MKTKSFLLILFNIFLITISSTNSIGQTFQWAKQIGSLGWDNGTSIVSDQNNNIYTVGLFTGTVDFDPGVGVYNLTSVGETDVFIFKLDSMGNFIWAKQYGDSAAIDEESSLGIDPMGNLYITNSFVGTVDFDPGTGSFYLSSSGWERTTFIQKLDSNGNFLWVKKISCSQPSIIFPTPVHCNAIAVDTSGNQYLTGYFDGTIDFDPDTNSVFNMTSTYQLSDIFICKLNTDGNFMWAKQFSGQTGGGVGYAIKVDNNRNIYSTGTIGGTVDFNPGSGTYFLTPSVPFQTEIFVSKLDSIGNFAWAKQMGPGEGLSLDVDMNSNSYSTGWSPSGFTHAITKLDSMGNVIWSKHPGGISGVSIATDNNNHIYTIGYCSGTNDFDPGAGTFNLSGGNSDSYISKLDSAGNFIWAGLLSGTNQVWAKSLVIDKSNHIYFTGYFDGTADFDPDSATTFNLIATLPSYDLFVVKLNSNLNVGLSKNDFEQNILMYPNPGNGQVTLKFETTINDVKIIVRNVLGQEIMKTNYTDTNQINLHIDGESGIYFMEIYVLEVMKVFKIIKE